MKKEPVLFLYAFMLMAICLPAVAMAQQVIYEAELELPTPKEGKASAEKVYLHGDGTVTVFSLVHPTALGQKAAQEAAFGKNGSTTDYPVLLGYRLSESLQLNSTMLEDFNAGSLREVSGRSFADALAGSSPGMPAGKGPQRLFSCLQAQYPQLNILQKPEKHAYVPAEHMLAGPLITHHSTRFGYDIERNSFMESRKEEIVPLRFPEEQKKWLYIHDRIKVQESAGLVSMVSGLKKDEQEPYAHYKEQQLNLFTLNGKLLSQYALAFSYPSEIRLHAFVREEGKQDAGIAYIFGAARRYGHQFSDPDPTNYELLYLDAEREAKFRHQYRYANRHTASEPFYAAAAGERLFVLGKGVGKKPDFHLLIFDKNGLQKNTVIDQSLLYENNVGDYHDGLGQAYASQYLVSGFKELEDGGFIFFGEHRTQLGSGVHVPGTEGQSSDAYEYRSYVFLHLNRKGDLIGNYVLKRGLSHDPYQPAGIQLLTADGPTLHLLLDEPLSIEEFTAGTATEEYPKTRSNGGPASIKAYPRPQSTPVVLSLNLKAREIKTLHFDGEFINHEEDRLYFDPQKEELLLVGASVNKQPFRRIILKKIKL